MDDEVGLWAWFLFHSGLPPRRAKVALAAWQDAGLTLTAALARLPDVATQAALTHAETAQLTPPRELPEVTAIRWDDPLYPAGLRELPLQFRPALLFYRGNPTLLSYPLIYFPPGELPAEDAGSLRETINLLIGEDLLPGAYDASAQLRLLLDEVAYGVGVAMLFARTGLDRWASQGGEDLLLEEGRLLVVSPLPPSADHEPALDTLLQRVAVAAANRVILAGEPGQYPHAIVGLGDKPALSLSDASAGTPLPESLHTARGPADVLGWVGELFREEIDDITETATAPSNQPATQPGDPDAEGFEQGPPPSPEEILNTLRKGGEVPEALRQRLLEASQLALRDADQLDGIDLVPRAGA